MGNTGKTCITGGHSRDVIMTSVVVMLVSLCLVSCNEATRVSFSNTESKSSSTSKSWGSASIIDNGTSTDIVNADTGDGCTGGTTDLLAAGSLGCSMPPAIVYTDSGQWMIGFTQENTAMFDFYTVLRSLTTKLFGTASVTGVANAATFSNRNIKIKKLPNGDLIAVFAVDNNASEREVYANIYTASTGTWGTAQLMSEDNVATDSGSIGAIGLGHSSILCRPDVAVAGDGTALISWCQDAGSVIKYRRYVGGAFLPEVITPTIPDSLSAEATKMFAGFKAASYNFVSIDTTNPANGTTDVSPAEIFNASDYYSFHFMVGDNTYAVTVKGTESTSPSTSEFKVERNSSGTLLVCDTMKKLASALLAQKISTGDRLSDLGFSFVVDPGCTAGSSATYNMTAYFNKAGNVGLRDTGATSFVKSNTDAFYDSTAGSVMNIRMQISAADHVRSGISMVRGSTYVCGGVCTENTSAGTYSCDSGCAIGNNSDPFDFFATTTVGAAFNRSNAVAIAGDGSGNYGLVRTGLTPVYTSTTDITSSGIQYARSLFGHEYKAGSGFKTFDSTVISTKKISVNESCNNSSTAGAYTPCGAKNPKFMMSKYGKGLVLYFQNQTTYSGATLANPNRIWYATYGVSGGYGNGSILDENTFCSSNSLANDVPVCETGSLSTACQSLQESWDISAAGLKQQYPTAGNDITHDITPIASDMNNEDGKAVVAYHKKYNLNTVASPVCTYTGVFARVYNPMTGFGSQIQLDRGMGDTTHVSVSINSSGEAAAVWEEVRTGSAYIYYAKFNGSSWSSAEAIVETTTAATDAMYPGVKINNSGEVVVSFTHGLLAGPRRQYVKHYE